MHGRDRCRLTHVGCRGILFKEVKRKTKRRFAPTGSLPLAASHISSSKFSPPCSHTEKLPPFFFCFFPASSPGDSLHFCRVQPRSRVSLGDTPSISDFCPFTRVDSLGSLHCRCAPRDVHTASKRERQKRARDVQSMTVRIARAQLVDRPRQRARLRDR